MKYESTLKGRAKFKTDNVKVASAMPSWEPRLGFSPKSLSGNVWRHSWLFLVVMMGERNDRHPAGRGQEGLHSKKSLQRREW